MKFKLHARHAAVLMALLGAATTGHVNAQSFYDNGQRAVLLGDPDNTGDGGAAILSEGSAAASGLVLYDAEGNTVNGRAELYGNDVLVRSNGGISLNSATTNTITGANNNINGTTTITGATSVTGDTTINTSGSAATGINTGTSTGNVTIGNSLNTTNIQSATNNINGTTNNINGTTNNVTGATNINVNTNAATSINSGSSTATVTIGNSLNTTNIQSGTNNITGVTNINASNNAATNINTGNSTGAVTLGNSANITSLNSATNNIGVNAYATTNNIGTGAAASTNSIGNAQTPTTVTATAGNASQSLANGSANTLVSGGASGLTPRTGVTIVATSAQVLLRNSGGTTIDANGKILAAGATGYVAPTAPTAALTLTNGYGDTHGVVVTESQTTVSGGTQSSSLTLTDTNARFSRASSGAPITVTGVADGRNDFDAVNVRQFAGAVAAVSAQANIPSLQQGQDRSIGLGVGNFMGKTALALGLNYRANNAAIYRLSVSTGTQAGTKPVVGAGAAWSF